MSRSKAEQEREKVIQERCQILLASLLKEEDNKYCVDCDSKGPRWASWNIGVFLCIRCAGIHRNLGVHISKVRSVNLDSWTPAQISSMQCMGNSRGRAVYEASVPDDFKRPNSDSALEQFIRAKYEKKKYIMKDWVATKPPDLPEGWNTLIEQEKLGKSRESKMAVLTPGSNGAKTANKSKSEPTSGLSAPRKSTSSAAVATAATKSSAVVASKPPATISAAVAPKVTSSAAVDLLGLSSTNDDDDLFSNFVSAPPAVSSGNGMNSSQSNGALSKATSNLEQDFFNQVSTTDSIPGTGGASVGTDTSKMSNSSIMALFSSVPQNKGPTMIASPAAPQAMGSYPNQQQRQPQQGQLYPGQQLQAFQQHQQTAVVSSGVGPMFNNNIGGGLDALAGLGGGLGGIQKGMLPGTQQQNPNLLTNQGVYQMNNQFSGLNVHPAGVQGGNSPNLIQGNTNQFSAANIKGLYNMTVPQVNNSAPNPNLFPSPGGQTGQFGGLQATGNLFGGAGSQLPGGGAGTGQPAGTVQQNTFSNSLWN